MIWRRCEGSGRRVDPRRWRCAGCGLPVATARGPVDVDPLITPRLLRCTYQTTPRWPRIPDHNRPDLVAMIRAGHFGPFGPEQMVLETSW